MQLRIHTGLIPCRAGTGIGLFVVFQNVIFIEFLTGIRQLCEGCLIREVELLVGIVGTVPANAIETARIEGPVCKHTIPFCIGNILQTFVSLLANHALILLIDHLVLKGREFIQELLLLHLIILGHSLGCVHTGIYPNKGNRFFLVSHKLFVFRSRRESN